MSNRVDVCPDIGRSTKRTIISKPKKTKQKNRVDAGTASFLEYKLGAHGWWNDVRIECTRLEERNSSVEAFFVRINKDRLALLPHLRVCATDVSTKKGAWTDGTEIP